MLEKNRKSPEKNKLAPFGIENRGARKPSRVHETRDPLKFSAEWRQSTILKMVLCAEWRQLQEWRRLAEVNPHGYEIIRLMQVRGDREQQPPADVGTACGNMTNLHVLLVMLTLMRVNPMVVMSERHSILRDTAPAPPSVDTQGPSEEAPTLAHSSTPSPTRG